MDIHVGHLTIRAARWAPVVAISVVTSSFVPSIHAETVSPPAAQGTTAPKAGTPTGADTPPASPAAESKTKPECENYVAVLSGKKKADATLASRALRAVGERSVDVIACRAIAADSDEPCTLDPEHRDDCRILQSTFHELRAHPQGRSFLFPDAKYEICRANPKLAPICDRLREAARSGDPDKCTGTGEAEAGCRAALTMDISLCADKGANKADEWGCKKGVEQSLLFAKGLKTLAESGPSRERAFAKAALGQKDACAPFIEAAAKDCSGPASQKPTTPPSSPVPTPPSTAPGQQSPPDKHSSAS